ncbi:MAG: mechanosensitive ion channel family protein [Candidatus Muiribacteriota bacterium]
MEFIEFVAEFFNIANYTSSHFWNIYLFGNSLGAYIASLFSFITALIILKFLNIFLFKNIKKIISKTPLKIDTLIVDLAEEKILPLLYFLPVFIVFAQLQLSPTLKNIIEALIIVVVAIQITKFTYLLINFLITEKWFNKDKTQITKTTFHGILLFIKISLVLLCVIFILDNLGFNISTIIAGLGIGGVAIALASQNILNDLFNYIVIFFDRPFEVGDFIIVGENAGVISYIGVKTTRMTSLSGEEIVFTNSDLTGSRVRNFKKMEKRRISFELGILYQTTAEQLKKIPGIVKDIIVGIDNTEFARCHFKEYGDFNLIIETVYYIDGNDYDIYMDIQQEINLKIKEAFDRERIGFAFPTQSLIFENKLEIEK